MVFEHRHADHRPAPDRGERVPGQDPEELLAITAAVLALAVIAATSLALELQILARSERWFRVERLLERFGR